jgi:hypothetical protein
MSSADPSDPIMLSALAHCIYCPRQCAPIHIEQTFTENVFTLRGQAVHRQVDIPGYEKNPFRGACRARVTGLVAALRPDRQMRCRRIRFRWLARSYARSHFKIFVVNLSGL